MSQLFYHTMQDNLGNLLFGVSGTMRVAGTGTLATIYGDEAMTVILPNPMTNHPSFGSFKCYLNTGFYDFYMAKAGYTFEVLTGVQGGGVYAITGIVNQINVSPVAGIGNVALGLPQDIALDSTVTFGSLGLGAPGVEGVALTTGTQACNLGGGLNVAGNTNITGNTIITPGTLAIGGSPVAGKELTVFGEAAMNGLDVSGPALFIGATTHQYLKASTQALTVRPTDTDTGPGNAIMFANVASTPVGAIATNATTTAYNTTSDARLKHDVDDLTGELDVIQALRPVRFKWNADDSDGHGFLAHEVAQVLAGVITGEANAVDEQGQIRPQMIDYSKLVPHLVGAVKTLAAQVEALQARVAVLEDAAGV